MKKDLQIVQVRMRVRTDRSGTVLCESTEYGVRIDKRRIKIGDREFYAGRKAGFGKSAYIHERNNGMYHYVVIDRIEDVVLE